MIFSFISVVTVRFFIENLRIQQLINGISGISSVYIRIGVTFPDLLLVYCIAENFLYIPVDIPLQVIKCTFSKEIFITQRTKNCFTSITQKCFYLNCMI